MQTQSLTHACSCPGVGKIPNPTSRASSQSGGCSPSAFLIDIGKTSHHTKRSLSVGPGKLGQANRYDSPPAYCCHSLAVKLRVPSLFFRFHSRFRLRRCLLFQRQVGTGRSIGLNIPNILPPLRVGEVAV